MQNPSQDSSVGKVEKITDPKKCHRRHPGGDRHSGWGDIPFILYRYICQGLNSLYWDGKPPTFNKGILISWGPINPYYKVDDHPLLHGNHGSLDPSTYNHLNILAQNSYLQRSQKPYHDYDCNVVNFCCQICATNRHCSLQHVATIRKETHLMNLMS